MNGAKTGNQVVIRSIITVCILLIILTTFLESPEPCAASRLEGKTRRAIASRTESFEESSFQFLS